jgi:hypothetical protein
MNDLTIQIPLFNEMEALEFSKFYFDSIDVDVHYVLDSQCLERTKALAIKLGVRYSEFRNDKPYIENGYENFSAASPTDWVLRIDCDEVPTPELIDFARNFARGGQGVASFERLQVIWRQGGFHRSNAARFAPQVQRQYRLFNRRNVEFDTAIHTPGIRIDAPAHAPSQACLYHMSWIYLSWDERLEKANRYDAYGQPPANRENQLMSLDDQDFIHVKPTIIDAVYARWISARQ